MATFRTDDVSINYRKKFTMRPGTRALLTGLFSICLVGCARQEPAVAPNSTTEVATPAVATEPNAKPEVQPDAARVTDGTYTNTYFGLTLPIPEGWFVASKDSEEFLREAGEEIAVGSDATLKAALAASKKNTFQLLTVSEFEFGAAVEFNPTLIVMAERVSHVPGIKTGNDYLFHTTKLLLRTQVPYELKQESHPTQLGGVEWHRADFVIKQNHVQQSYFALKRKDFVLMLILSAATADQMQELEQIAATVGLQQ